MGATFAIATAAISLSLLPPLLSPPLLILLLLLEILLLLKLWGPHCFYVRISFPCLGAGMVHMGQVIVVEDIFPRLGRLT